MRRGRKRREEDVVGKEDCATKSGGVGHNKWRKTALSFFVGRSVRVGCMGRGRELLDLLPRSVFIAMHCTNMP